MSPVFAIIFVLVIIFVLICLECILRKKISYVVTKAIEDEHSIEIKIRDIITKNPSSEIIVICCLTNQETLLILNKLKDEFSQLHII